MTLSHSYDVALLYAHGLHRRQQRKGTPIPYISHLLSVSSLVLEHGGTETEAIAALLHDAAEDQGGAARLEEIREHFGEAVANIVRDCTDAWTEPKPEWRTRKETYIAALEHKPAASLRVSLADKTHNAEAILRDYLREGERTFERFNGGAAGTRWYYGALLECFERRLPGELCERLGRAVEGFADAA
ncbi:MAG: HD domain-containing protein [Proteobacteria bacterium]|nr:HD domain-containing protein [Pseudomonadota bacterium]